MEHANHQTTMTPQAGGSIIDLYPGSSTGDGSKGSDNQLRPPPPSKGKDPSIPGTKMKDLATPHLVSVVTASDVARQLIHQVRKGLLFHQNVLRCFELLVDDAALGVHRRDGVARSQDSHTWDLR